MDDEWQFATDPPGAFGRLPVRTSGVTPNVATHHPIGLMRLRRASRTDGSSSTADAIVAASIITLFRCALVE